METASGALSAYGRNGEIQMISLILAKKILSLFLILAMGFLAVRSGVVDAKESKTLSTISLYVIMPCVILSSFQVDYTREVLDGLILAFAAAICIHIGLLVVTALVGRLLKLDAVEKASVIYSNAGNLIIPLVTALLGKEWVIYSCAFVCVQQTLLWTHAKMLLCGEKKPELRKIVTNVNMISIFAGILLFLSGIRFPAVIQDALDATSVMVGPSAMIVTGMLIGGMDRKKLFSYRRAWLVAALRLVILPLLAVAFLKRSPLAAMVPGGETVLLITLLAAIAPPAATITQMALVYGQDADYAGAANIVSTLLCIITMPVMVMVYQI